MTQEEKPEGRLEDKALEMLGEESKTDTSPEKKTPMNRLRKSLYGALLLTAVAAVGFSAFFYIRQNKQTTPNPIAHTKHSTEKSIDQIVDNKESEEYTPALDYFKMLGVENPDKSQKPTEKDKAMHDKESEEYTPALDYFKMLGVENPDKSQKQTEKDKAMYIIVAQISDKNFGITNAEKGWKVRDMSWQSMVDILGEKTANKLYAKRVTERKEAHSREELSAYYQYIRMDKGVAIANRAEEYEVADTITRYKNANAQMKFFIQMILPEIGIDYYKKLGVEPEK